MEGKKIGGFLRTGYPTKKCHFILLSTFKAVIINILYVFQLHCQTNTWGNIGVLRGALESTGERFSGGICFYGRAMVVNRILKTLLGLTRVKEGIKECKNRYGI